MAQITALVSQKNSGRVNVYLDGEFAFGLSADLIVDHNLYKGRELKESDITKIKDSESRSKALFSAYRLLAVRQRSEDELKKRLAKKFDPKTIEDTIKKLTDYKLLSDEDFAARWIEERKQRKGKRALLYELRKKGVSREIYDPLLDKISLAEEFEFAKKEFERKFEGKDMNSKKEKERALRFLLGRGFPYEIIYKLTKSHE